MNHLEEDKHMTEILRQAELAVEKAQSCSPIASEKKDDDWVIGEVQVYVWCCEEAGSLNEVGEIPWE